jgi:hypothetical protein
MAALMVFGGIDQFSPSLNGRFKNPKRTERSVVHVHNRERTERGFQNAR